MIKSRRRTSEAFQRMLLGIIGLVLVPTGAVLVHQVSAPGGSEYASGLLVAKVAGSTGRHQIRF